MAYKFIDEKGEHLHTFEGKPLIGTSSVCDVMAKPLTWWALGLGLKELGWSPINNKETKKPIPFEERLPIATEYFEKIKKLNNEDYLKLLDKAYYAHKNNLKETAQKGTNLHAELEKFVLWKMEKKEKVDFAEQIIPFIEWANENVEKFIWAEAHCYSDKMWIGGISDAGAVLKNGKMAIIDFKSAKEAYTSSFIQCAGYALQIEENGLTTHDGQFSKKLDSKFEALIVVPFGAKKVIPEIRYNVEDYKKAFQSALILYKLLLWTEKN